MRANERVPSAVAVRLYLYMMYSLLIGFTVSRHSMAGPAARWIVISLYGVAPVSRDADEMGRRGPMCRAASAAYSIHNTVPFRVQTKAKYRRDRAADFGGRVEARARRSVR